jgi:hypothetical protein
MTQEFTDRKICTDNLLKKLIKEGFKTDGYEYSLERILTSHGFGFPSECEEGFGFTVNHKWTRIYLNYADALAQEILFLRHLKLI